MIQAVIISALITFGLRAIPYVFFGNRTEMPPAIDYLGKYLPPAIMAALVVYTTKDLLLFNQTFWPMLGALAVTTATHLWRRNTFLSIVVGTALYMILLRL